MDFEITDPAPASVGAGKTLVGIGVNLRTAPLALLERVSFPADAMADLLAGLCSAPDIYEAFGISTCNRTEFLLLTDNVEESVKLLLARVFDRKGVDLAAEAAQTFCLLDEDAVRHIFQVACGVDSLVVGENEILGQLRRARELASDAGFLGEGLDPVLLRAIDVGRRARQSTAISRGNVSVASVAATLAARALGDLSDKRGLVLGAGKTGEAAAVQLFERGLQDLTILNRGTERGHQLAAKLGAAEASLDNIAPHLQTADVALCATASQNFIITEPLVRAAMEARGGRPLMLLDLSVPRNIDPAVAAIAGVHLHSLEDMTQLAAENRLQREEQVREVNAFVEQELVAWRGLRNSADCGRLVSELHRRLDHVRREYVRRHEGQFGAALQDQLDLFSSGLARALLHDLVENVRGLDLETLEGRRRYEVARELLNIGREKAN